MAIFPSLLLIIRSVCIFSRLIKSIGIVEGSGKHHPFLNNNLAGRWWGDEGRGTRRRAKLAQPHSLLLAWPTINKPFHASPPKHEETGGPQLGVHYVLLLLSLYSFKLAGDVQQLMIISVTINHPECINRLSSLGVIRGWRLGEWIVAPNLFVGTNFRLKSVTASDKKAKTKWLVIKMNDQRGRI